MIVYFVTDGDEYSEYFETKKKALDAAEEIRRGGSGWEITVEKEDIGKPTKKQIVRYLNGEGYRIGSEIIGTLQPIEDEEAVRHGYDPLSAIWTEGKGGSAIDSFVSHLADAVAQKYLEQKDEEAK